MNIILPLLLLLSSFHAYASKPDTYVYAGAKNGHVYRLIEGEHQWQALSALDGSAINSVFASSSTTLYAGTKSGHIYYSTNSGQSWLAIPSPDANLSPIKSVFFLDSTLYIGTSKGRIYYSINHGITWSSSSQPDSNGSSVSCLFLMSKDILYAGTDSGYIYYSNNRGASWQTINGQPDGSGVRSLFVANGMLYVATHNELVYLSSSLIGGGSWGSPIIQSAYRFFISTDGLTQYASTKSGYLFSLPSGTQLGLIVRSPITSISKV